jgi:hypothetical protein
MTDEWPSDEVMNKSLAAPPSSGSGREAASTIRGNKMKQSQDLPDDGLILFAV